ncbi:AraC family ligand binding domain-containing protein [Pedobacter westerhofensis]|uniref:AraC family ligand binding domain-containing protein n=1 Tax=Pedobacter westerhofensis TaxID=425512 RepID=UPI00163DD9A9
MKQNLYYPFEILYKEVDQCSKQGYSQNFFELVYVVEGSGVQHINNNVFNYATGHLLLIHRKTLILLKSIQKPAFCLFFSTTSISNLILLEL